MSSSAYVFETWPRSTYVIVWLTTSGHRILRGVRSVGAQNQPRESMKPTPCLRAFERIAVLVCCWVFDCTFEQVFMFDLESSRQSVGSRR